MLLLQSINRFRFDLLSLWHILTRIYFVSAGLPLIPIADGSFATFSVSDDSAEESHLYIPSEAHPAALLPMINHQFIDISNRITDDIIKHLKNMAVKGEWCR